MVEGQRSPRVVLETGWYTANGEPYAKRYRAFCEEFL
jgi:hypothetical protein